MKKQCPNPLNNPNCKKISGVNRVCKSCAFYLGRKHICEKCGIEFEYRGDTFNKFCSRSCYRQSEIHTGKGNYFYGGLSKKDKASRENSIKNRSEEQILKTKQLMSHNMKTLWEDENYRLHQVTVKADLISSGKFNPHSRHKRGSYISKNGIVESYHSLWELAHMIQLDETNQAWTKKHNIKIEYFIDGKIHKYTPDFLINGNIIEEVKPDPLMKLEINIIKHHAAEVFCDKNGYIFNYIHYIHIKDFLESAAHYHETRTKSN